MVVGYTGNIRQFAPGQSACPGASGPGARRVSTLIPVRDLRTTDMCTVEST
jgi:hypothetical protein